MAKRELQENAIELRKKGMSYSQIREQIPVSKGTLSLWLRDFPLSKKRIRELRDTSPKRIESYRNTMKEKRDGRQHLVYEQFAKDFKKLNKRERFIAGMFLYWGEGGKTDTYRTSMANTDPGILKFFLVWLRGIGVDSKKLKVKLHLYSDMDEKKEKTYWSKELGVSESQFIKSYIKDTKRKDNYKHRFHHGTCNVYYDNRDVTEYVLEGLRYVQNLIK